MVQSFVSVTILLILITDPLGNIPAFISVLKNVKPSRRIIIVLRECTIAFFTLLLFMLFGRNILDLLNLSEDTLKVAGGVLLFLIAINMIFPGTGAKTTGEEGNGEPLIVPIAIPLISGPSAMVTVMLIAGSEPGRMLEWIGALSITITITTIVFLFSVKLKDILGNQTITALERLMGLILTAISMEMLLSGVANYIRNLIM